MLAPVAVLLLSILFQVTALLLTVRLIPVTGRLKAWMWISAAILLMVIRRCITLFDAGWAAIGVAGRVDMAAEIVAMATSLFLVIGIAHITPVFRSLKQAKEALAAESERLAVTLRSIGDGVVAADTQGRVVLMNGVAEKLTGWTQPIAVGRPFEQVFHAVETDKDERTVDPVQGVLKSGGMCDLPRNTVLIDRHGSRRAIQDSAAPILSSGGEIQGVVLVFRDVTEERRTEQKLIQAQKLESLGVLAGGIAHDFNNVLTAIIGNIELAKIYLSPESKAHDRLMQAERATRNATELARRLLTFSRGGMPVKEPVSLSAVLNDEAMVGLSRYNVTWKLEISPGTWAVEIDKGQIRQALNNLLINAADAMPEGGVVRIRAENRIVERGSDVELEPGRYVKISVIDQGCGIPEEHLSKVFDPFFTTKGKRSGLGLATVYSVVKKHGGAVEAESKPGEGATFTFYLPATDTEIPETVAHERRTVPPGAQKILFMDDDALVRKSAEESFRQLGYRAEFAEHGAQAVQMYRSAMQARVPFDVVFLDLTIRGGMGGVEALRHLKEIDANVKAIVCSGYSDDQVMADPKRYGFIEAVPKPYHISDLVSAIGAVTGRSPAA